MSAPNPNLFETSGSKVSEADRVNVLGVGISAINMDIALKVITDAIRRREKGYICVSDVRSVMEAYDNEYVRRVLNEAMLCTPDGMPLVWLSHVAGRRHVRRVYGPDLMLALCELSCREGFRHFFYGGSGGTAAQLAAVLQKRFPGLQVTGWYEPPFRPLQPDEEQQLVDMVREQQPDIFWVGLSTPKQDKFMAEYLAKLDVTVMVGVGAAFDFHTGRVKQAPRWMQQWGLEWVFRLYQEPRRLWRRYLRNNPRFLAQIVLQQFGLKKFDLRRRATKPAVLVIVENLPVPLDRRVWQEACALRDAGYEVSVICPQSRGFVIPAEKLDGINVYRHWISEEAGGFSGFFREYGSALWGEWWLAWKAWRRHRFKVIHLCNPPDLLFLIAWPFKLLGVKIVCDVHDLWPEMFEAKFGHRGLFYWVVRTAERLTYECADVVMATNHSVKNVALTRGKRSAKRVFVVRTAPKIKDVDRPVDPALRKGRQLLVGYIGVMGDVDGVNYLIDAADHIINRRGRNDVQFLAMGTGAEYERLLEQRDRLGLKDYVDMPGHVSNEFLFTALRTIDLGVACDPINPYNNHCTMNKVLEYMAFGKPQVMFATKEGRASAGDAADYVTENSATKLGDAILKLLDDPARREQMGKLGAERLRTELNWERSVEQLLRAYETALS
jgi:exopolysaccharide biosynthesis WecB/TagA/CpsF family protein